MRPSLVRGINAGVDGFNRWSFTNRGDLDGHWELVHTWDIQGNKLEDTFTPQPNAYYQYAMLTRYFPKHSSVLATKVETPFALPDRKLVATALRSPKGNLTVLVVNESHHAAEINVAFEGLPSPCACSATRWAKKLKTRPPSTSTRAHDRGEQNAHRPHRADDIVVYSTYNLKATDPGLINE